MTGLFMFNVFDFFFQIKRIMKVLKNFSIALLMF